MNDEFYIYFLIDPETPSFSKGGFVLPHEPIYIGKGKGNRVHSTKNRNKWLSNKINSLERKGLQLNKITIGPYTEEEAFIAEKRFIETFGRKFLKEGPLLNIHEGGQGSFSYINKHLPNAMLNKHHSEETKEKIRQSRIGKPQKRYSDTGQKISEGLKQYWKRKKENATTY